MSEECTHDCSSCGSSSCGEKKAPEKDKLNDRSSVKKLIAVVSGKGGVGKSMVTSLLTVATNEKGYRTAILDADVTGSSVPKIFGIKDLVYAEDDAIIPALSRKGTQVMSVNLLLDDETTPVVWRGPVISGTVRQFWTDVVWDNVDYMYVDMPPGTGDVPLTVFSQLPVDGIVIVTSPQDLVSMIVAKAVNMAKLMNVPILGIVENMSGFVCPDCGKRIDVFGKSKLEEVAAKYDLEILGRLPIDPELASLCDKGEIESRTGDYLCDAAEKITRKLKI